MVREKSGKSQENLLYSNCGHPVFDIVVYSNSTTMKFWRSKPYGDLSQGLHVRSIVCQHFQRASSLKLLGQFYFNFICSLLAKGKRKFIFCPGHMTKMATMPLQVRTLKIFFSRTIGPVALKL